MQRSSRWIKGGLALCALGLGWSVTSASALAASKAKAASSYTMQQKAIVLKGSSTDTTSTETKPYGFAEGQTMYMPIWYVMNVLQSVGVQSTWSNNVWNLVVPKSFTVDLSNIDVGSGAISLQINGTLVHKVNGIAAVDPASGKSTTFIPIWYIQQLLQRVGVKSQWDGTTWTLDASSLPPVLPSNEVETWQLISDINQAFGISPDPSGPSPYTDLPATDAEWGDVHAAIEKGIYQPPSATLSGAYDPLSVQTADQMLWNAYGMTTADAVYQPGEEPYQWATDVGLNPPNLQETDFVTPQEFSEMVSNLGSHQQGFVETGSGTYQICYPIADEAVATFDGDTRNKQSFFSSNDAIQAAIDATYQFFNNLQLTNQSGQWTLSVPSLSGEDMFSYITGIGNVSYQAPGQTGWQSAASFDSRVVNIPSGKSAVVQVPADGLIISVNEMLPQLSGTVVLGELSISIGPNGPVVQRINVNS
ncbi:hypothetical protein [Alicyclobacillus acidiphilus]|uniref:hypothetical protein n=1 Tax=Alicyclobacillus acidiphilus TaxID=182455 RepID=UPI000831429B|nr:hypothetical protein [Alicyclobacillus acidiphilus]